MGRYVVFYRPCYLLIANRGAQSNWLEGMILMCKVVLPALEFIKANQYDRPVSYYCRNVLVLSGKVCAVSTVSSYQRLIIFHHSEITEILERCS